MTTMKKVIKKLGRRWYKNDRAINCSIQHCVDFGFTTKDSLKYLFEHHGCEMDERTFRRIKKTLPTSNTQKVIILSDQAITFIQESIGDLCIAKNELVKIITDPNTSVALKIHASTAIAKNLITMAEFYDLSPVIDGLSQIKGDDGDAIQKLEEISEKKLP